MTFVQDVTAVGGNLGLTALVAVIPILYFFWALAIKRMKGYIAGLTTLLIALILAVAAFGMPAQLAVMSATHGAVYGIIPIGWIIISSVFLYKLTVKTGQFDIIRNSIISITEDRRLQALLVAFSFGAFLEGAAGFGAPVAISAALLVGLGFNPLYAAGLCLIANTAPVAFGAIGAPILALEGPTGIPAIEISKMVGRQLPFLSIFIPFYLIVIMAGFKKALEVMPAILVTGITFSLTQFLSSNYLGPELPDILSALVSILVLGIFLKFWKPKTIFRFSAEKELASTLAVNEPDEDQPHTDKQILKAWSPFFILTAIISIWGIPVVKQALTGHYEGSNLFLTGLNSIGQVFTFIPNVPLLNNKVINVAGDAVPAFYKLEFLGAAGTAVLIAAIITKFIFQISWKDWLLTFAETLSELKFPIITIASVVGYAYVTNASGMSTAMGMILAKTGVLFPFFSPILGWLGVFITGSDTSSNLLFGNMQQVTANSIGMDPVLAVSANSSGGVTGKMISPQSIAVACAAVGLAGKESDLFRFTIKHSIFLVILIGIMTFLQNGVLSWMIP
ncbi:lactate permease LctP family transporter [Peribacillus psychrosaccharolyticus]|uniref:L-lactate permease n=2 Tax=Peribacillus psychrosaccharolyticus TaxID=1407 RepID=A0A974S221_PERPY|nr:lactate permease LctP family transporter [Peribacillus psychrosaccharolyticus]MEC2057723.1 lactate permease LctP family transporter [Peribacillus psychrosaccharolyticus]MED3744747.1 lactate permease LctP family transporter [Peribacillus psychrosaccharolyticus]QQT02262.1 lactate permease LctP family transporter [Peribacillus psychrosaccharolyticus]